MIRQACIGTVAALALSLGAAARADQLTVSLEPAASNPASPQMGDQLKFQSVIEVAGEQPVEGVIAWISLVRVDPGQERPVDLEDWSAQKAVTCAQLRPGEQIKVDWPMRLIQAGEYRVVISAVGRNATALTTSPFIGFSVRAKPVVELARILPVAFGMPLLIGALFGWRRLRSR